MADEADASTTVVEMPEYGQWLPLLGRQVYATLRESVVGPASAVIVDPHDVGELQEVSQHPVWVTAARTAQ